MTATDVNAWLVQTWHQYTGLLIVAGGVVGLLILAGVLTYAKASRKPIRPAVIWLASNLALLLNAEGMWVIATKTLKLPAGFAVLVFAVFEVSLMVAMSLASEQYRRTTERDEQTKKITKLGHPGKMLYVAWMIAILSGVIVASNAASTTETILRLALPLIVTTMWWATMTAEGQTRRRGRFAYSPTRLMERYGLLTPDDDPDYERMARERRIRAMVTYGHRLETGVLGAWWHEWRLTRLARVADETMAAEVAEQLDRTIGIVNRVVPSRRETGERVRAEVEQAERTDAGQVAALPTTGQTDHRAALPAPMPAVRLGEPAPTVAALPGPRRGDGWADDGPADRFAAVLPAAERTGGQPASRTDGELLAEHGAELVGVFRSTGKITRYRVERVCGVGGRQADRIKAAIEGGWQLPINGSAVPGLIGR